MKRTPRRQLQHTWLIKCIQSFLFQNLLDHRRNALIKIFYFRNWNHGSLLLTRSPKFLNIGRSATWNPSFEVSPQRLNYIDIWWHRRPITKHADLVVVQKKSNKSGFMVLRILVTNLSSKRSHIQLNSHFWHYLTLGNWSSIVLWSRNFTRIFGTGRREILRSFAIFLWDQLSLIFLTTNIRTSVDSLPTNIENISRFTKKCYLAIWKTH